MRNQVFTVSAAPKDIQAFAESRRALYVSTGKHTIYDGHVRMGRDGQTTAQEVLASGSAQLTLHGHIMCKLWGSASAKAGPCASIELRQESSATTLGGFVQARDKSRVRATQSHIFVIAGSPTIIARACVIVIYPGATPTLDIDTHTAIYRCPGAEESTPRAFAVAEAGAAV